MKNLKYILIISILASCSQDRETIPPISSNLLKTSYHIDRFRVLEITPNINDATFTWKIDGQEYSHQKTLEFISTENKSYALSLEITTNNQTYTYNSTINVEKEKQEYSKYISKVLEFRPSVGQFINKIPTYNSGNTEQEMIQAAANSIIGNTKDFISLGGYGGYVVFGFDHTLPNLKGNDIKIFGNAFKGSSEPGIVMVAYDKNKNGKPDAEEWYEIAGSEHHKKETIKNYSITYHKPNENNPDQQYIKWEDNQGNNGYKTKNKFHRQSYYPLWISDNSLQFSGTKLANNYIKGSNNHWIGTAPEFGYVDVHTNGDEIDISWAIDKNGNSVHLIGIDFIKIYTATNQEAGWLGEISTEVTKAESIWLQ